MSILDDAIREHLELKRAHGADEAEVKKLEDEAFGPPQRPGEADAFGEAPTEFLTAPAEVVEEAAKEVAEGRRAPNIADLQEAPPAPAPAPAEESPAPADEPSVEEQPAAEHQIVPDSPVEPEAPAAEEPPKLDGVHTTEEREAIADQPTEMFDVEAEMQSGAEAESPSDEQLLDAEMAEPRLAPVDPIAGIDASAAAPQAEEEIEDEEDDFFSEQRLSEELHKALDEPLTDEERLPSLPPVETEEHTVPPPAPEPSFPPTEEGTAIFDIEEHLAGEERGEDEGDYEDEGESGEYEAIEPEAAAPAPPAESHEESEDHNPYDPETGSHEDVLEDTPEFLEDAPEDDNAWFEQRPPKDFDFDD